MVQGTVQAAQGSRSGNTGKNAFDELAPIGDTGAEVCAAPENAGGTGPGTGPTEAPDLTSVGNFRRGPFTSQFTPATCGGLYLRPGRLPERRRQVELSSSYRSMPATLSAARRT